MEGLSVRLAGVAMRACDRRSTGWLGALVRAGAGWPWSRSVPVQDYSALRHCSSWTAPISFSRAYLFRPTASRRARSPSRDLGGLVSFTHSH